jgi:hypothetical protein
MINKIGGKSAQLADGKVPLLSAYRQAKRALIDLVKSATKSLNVLYIPFS